MTPFEQGFRDELQKIAASMSAKSFTNPAKKLDTMISGGASGKGKAFATAIRSPLSLITAMKPPKQTFYKGI